MRSLCYPLVFAVFIPQLLADGRVGLTHSRLAQLAGDHVVVAAVGDIRWWWVLGGIFRDLAAAARGAADAAATAAVAAGVRHAALVGAAAATAGPAATASRTLCGGFCSGSFPGGTSLGGLLLQYHRVEFTRAFLELAIQDRHLLRRSQRAAGATARRLAAATAVIAATGTALSIGAAGPAATRLFLAGGTALGAALAIARVTHSLFHRTQYFLETRFVAEIRNALPGSRGIAKAGFGGPGLVSRATGGFEAWFAGTGLRLIAGAAGITGKLSLGKLTQVALLASSGGTAAAGGTAASLAARALGGGLR